MFRIQYGKCLESENFLQWSICNNTKQYHDIYIYIYIHC